jgi:hypothetical protein
VWTTEKCSFFLFIFLSFVFLSLSQSDDLCLFMDVALYRVI